MNVSWTGIRRQFQNGMLRHYYIRLVHVDGAPGSQSVYSHPASPIVLTDLHPFYNYTVEVAGYTVARGPYSAPQSIQMPQDG